MFQVGLFASRFLPFIVIIQCGEKPSLYHDIIEPGSVIFMGP
jgi:hypothetical protein